jgi:peroxiredoxin
VELQESLAEYERSGIAVFAISYDSVGVLGAFGEKYGISYPLLSDDGSVVIRRLGLLNERVAEHHAFYGVPMRDDVFGVPYPGAFILDQHGVVVERRFEDSYRVRETAVGVLEAAFGSTSSHHGAEARAAGTNLAARVYLDSPTYRMMQRLRLTVELQLEPGLHVYGDPIPDGYVPLSVEVGPIEGLDVGQLEAPRPKPFRVAGLDEQFYVYDGSVTVTVPLTFGQAVGDQVVEVLVRCQACSETECSPPEALHFRLPVTVLNHVQRPG